jgi:HK97 gp10 family phage protein
MAEIFKVSGLDEIGRALAAFGPELGKKYLAKATFVAAAVYRDQAKATVEVLSGQTQESISVFKRKTDDTSAHYAVGIRRVKLNKKVKRVLRRLHRAGFSLHIESDPYYWRFLELGWHDKDGKFHIFPFLRPAMQKTAQALSEFRDSLADGVEKAARAVSAAK